MDKLKSIVAIPYRKGKKLNGLSAQIHGSIISVAIPYRKGKKFLKKLPMREKRRVAIPYRKGKKFLIAICIFDIFGSVAIPYRKGKKDYACNLSPDGMQM